MRRLNITVFDEFLSNVVGYANGVVTSQELNSRLGQFDQLGIFAVVDNIITGSNISVQIEHSSDGRNWITKGTQDTGAEIYQKTIGANATTAVWGSDTGTSPTLGFVRLKIWFGANINCHVRIHVTGRDMGG